VEIQSWIDMPSVCQLREVVVVVVAVDVDPQEEEAAAAAVVFALEMDHWAEALVVVVAVEEDPWFRSLPLEAEMALKIDSQRFRSLGLEEDSCY